MQPVLRVAVSCFVCSRSKWQILIMIFNFLPITSLNRNYTRTLYMHFVFLIDTRRESDSDGDQSRAMTPGMRCANKLPSAAGPMR